MAAHIFTQSWFLQAHCSPCKTKMKWRRAIPALLYTTIDIPIALDLNWGLKLKAQDRHQFLPPTTSVTAPTIALAFLQLCTTVYGLWLVKWCRTPQPYKTAALVSEVLNISATTGIHSLAAEAGSSVPHSGDRDTAKHRHVTVQYLHSLHLLSSVSSQLLTGASRSSSLNRVHVPRAEQTKRRQNTKLQLLVTKFHFARAHRHGLCT